MGVVAGSNFADPRRNRFTLLCRSLLAELDPHRPRAIAARDRYGSVLQESHVLSRALLLVHLQIDITGGLCDHRFDGGVGAFVGFGLGEEREETRGALGAHGSERFRPDVVGARVVGDPPHIALPVLDPEPDGHQIHRPHAAQIQHAAERLVEEPRTVFEAHYLERGRETQLEGKAVQQPFADAVNRPDQRLRHPLGELRAALAR